jgi:hypothetical protein
LDFETAAKRWKEGLVAWERRNAAYFEFADPSRFDQLGEYWEFVGGLPLRESYRPKWSEDERTHFQMYENVSEGTPLSPVMESPESLARWLADNNADAGAGQTATYEEWLRVCLGNPAPTFGTCDGRTVNGVSAGSK